LGASPNIYLQWKTQPGGTGAMTKGLRSDELDLAVVLTEGIVADIIKGNPSKLVQMYVRSPLIWGIHCGADSRFANSDQIEEAIFAISRYGSGSHIMAFVFAEQQGWAPSQLKFEVVGNFDGARAAFKDGSADILLWEKFTTKPFVDSGELKRIGQTITPWPCFMIAATDRILNANRKEVKEVLRIIRKYCYAFMSRPDAIELVADRYGLEEKDAKTWYHQTVWSANNYISKKMLENVVRTLESVKVIEASKDVTELCDEMLWFDLLVE